MPVEAYNYPLDPPPYIVNQNIYVAISSTSPTKTIFINVTKHVPQQFLKNITIEFSEPITTTSFIISLLSDKPPNLCAPSDGCVLQYYYIRTYVELKDKVRNVVMNFAIDKITIKSRDVKEEDLTVYRSYGQRFEKCYTRKVVTDNLIYLSVGADGLGYFAIAGMTFSLHKIILITVATVVVMAAAVAFIFRKFKLRSIFKNLWRNLHEL
ncbi:MAG: PGF-pre-PGF domain-containing protein [Candidatus Bathyarchaeia archaeon]